MINNYLCGNNFKNICDFVYGETKIGQSGIVFCKTDFIYECFNELRKKRGPFVLVTHNSDHAINQRVSQEMPDNIVKLFGQNVEVVDDRIVAIPIGIGNPEWAHGNFELIENQHVREDKNITLLSCFNTRTSPGNRISIERHLNTLPYTTFYKDIRFEDYLDIVARSTFIASPRGNGVDCHRTWEALYLGSIPIVDKNICMESFKDFPIMLVSDWTSINIDLLSQEYQRINKNDYDWSFLYIDYWHNKMRKYIDYE